MPGNWPVLFGKGPTEKDSAQRVPRRRPTSLGGRAGATDPPQGGHRAPARPYTLAWLSKCRAILVRWDKKAANYLGLLKSDRQ
jgi:hypothetical protein